jgi:PEP-CTERM motif
MTVTISPVVRATLTLLVATAASIANAATPQLTAGSWNLTGTDTGGNSWAGSTITFETQSASGVDFSVSGFFFWNGNGGQYFGRENFTGTLFANNHLAVTGIAIIPPSRGIVSGATYEADVTPNGDRMINGTWGGGSIIPSNSWVAAQVPEPATIALLLPGAAILAFALRTRRRTEA